MVVPIARQFLSVWLTVTIFAVWAFFAMILRPGWPLQLTRCLYLVPLWLMYAFCEAMRVGMDDRFIGGSVLFLAPAFIYEYYGKDRGILTMLTTVGIISFMAGSIMSVKVLWVHPLAARLMSTNWVISAAYAYLGHSGVGDFRFTYGVAMLAPLMVAIAAGTDRAKWLRVSMVVCACVFVYYLYLAAFAMSIYIVIAGTFLAVFFHIKRLPLKFAASLLTVVAGLLFLVFGADLMLYIARNVNSEVLAIKARAAASLLPGGQHTKEGQFASDRISLYGTSFKTLLEHPIAGVGAYYSVAGVDVGLEQGIGGHSDLLDNLARYGLVGAGLYLPILFPLAFRAVSEGKGTAYGKSALAMWVLFFLMCCSNPVSGQTEVGVSVFLLWPALPKVFAARGTIQC
ncbi:MAG: O-antigen ligase family protein [Terracidiphilus sp.]|nr:O-antigen ligase family protein [Terracidiphilus sp.]